MLWGQNSLWTVTVVDPSGAPIPAARVVLETSAGDEVASSDTNPEGVATLEGVSPNLYTLEVRAENFALYRREHRARSGGLELRVELALATVATTIEVEAAPEPPIATIQNSAGELAEIPSVDLVENLRSTPGVHAIRRGGINVEPIIQGLRETQIAMIVDNSRTFAAGPARMDSELSHVDPGYVENIRVVTGPYALTEGSGAMSAIVVNTPQVPRYDDWRFGGKASAGYGFNGSDRFGRLNLFGGNNAFGFSLFGSGKQGNNYRASSRGPEDIWIPGRYGGYQLGGKFRFNFAERHEVTLGGFYDEQTNVDYPGRLLDAAHFILRSYSGRYLVANPAPGMKSIRLNGFLNKKSHRMTNDNKPTALDNPNRRPPFGLDVSLPTESDTAGGAGRFDFEPAPTWSLSTGFDLYWLNQDAQRFVARRRDGLLLFSDAVWPDAEINDQGVYVQTVKSFERGELAGTLRFDFVQANAGRPSDFFLENTVGDLEQNEFNTSFSIAGHRRLTDRVSLGGGFGRVARTASVLERYSDRFPSTKFQIAAEFMGEPGIKPEIGYQGDLSLDIKVSSSTFQVGGFLRRINNYITIAPDPDLPKRLPLSPPIVYRYVSGDHANFRGFYFAVRHPFARFLELRVYGSKTIADDIQEDVPAVGLNEPLIGIPPYEIRSTLRATEPRGRFWGEFTVRNVWDQRRVAASRFEQPSPGFSTFDLRFGSILPARFQLYFGLSNFSDKHYFEHVNSLNPFTRQRIPEPGRNFYAALTKSF
jgi:iron complex outermembrane receptor protein